MYGVTELEKFHVMPGVGLLQGLSDRDRDEFIHDSVKVNFLTFCFNSWLPLCTFAGILGMLSCFGVTLVY